MRCWNEPTERMSLRMFGDFDHGGRTNSELSFALLSTGILGVAGIVKRHLA